MVLDGNFKKNTKKSFTLKTKNEKKQEAEEETVEEIMYEIQEEKAELKKRFSKEQRTRLKTLGIDLRKINEYPKKVFHAGKLTKGCTRWYVGAVTDLIHKIDILEMKEEFPDDEKIIGMIEHKQEVLEGLLLKADSLKVKKNSPENKKSDADEKIEQLEKPLSYDTKGKCIECKRLTIINDVNKTCIICDDVVDLKDYIDSVYEELTMTNEQIVRLLKKNTDLTAETMKLELNPLVNNFKLIDYHGEVRRAALIMLAEHYQIDLLDDKWYAFPEKKNDLALSTKEIVIPIEKDQEEEVQDEISKEKPFVNILGGSYEKLSECHSAFLYVLMSNKFIPEAKAEFTDTELRIVANIEKDLIERKLIAKLKNNTWVLL